MNVWLYIVGILIYGYCVLAQNDQCNQIINFIKKNNLRYTPDDTTPCRISSNNQPSDEISLKYENNNVSVM